VCVARTPGLGVQRTHARAQAHESRQAGNAQARAVLQNDLQERGEKSLGLIALLGAGGLFLVLDLHLLELLLLQLELDLQCLPLEALRFLRTQTHHNTHTQTHE